MKITKPRSLPFMLKRKQDFPVARVLNYLQPEINTANLWTNHIQVNFASPLICMCCTRDGHMHGAGHRTGMMKCLHLFGVS